ncbi:MAG: redoxin domain-containing protein, partial [Chitinophagaceae bacterium]
FQGDEALDAGMYLIVMPPANNYYQIVVNPSEQFFSIEAESPDPNASLKIKGSADFQLFHNYVMFLQEKRKKYDKLSEQMNAEEATSQQKTTNKKELDLLDKEVKTYKLNIIKTYPTSITALLFKSMQEIEIPAGIKEDNTQAYYYYRNHYFDNTDLSDERLLRTPEFYSRINKYLEKLTVQNPDSIIISVDQLIQKARHNPKTFQFWASDLLNKYAKSKIVGMDAVYVHIADNYYSKSQTPWIEETNLAKITDNAKTLRPLLIGKIAPDISIQTLDDKPIKLHDEKARYTILYFWNLDCVTCKKSIANLKNFYKEYKNKGVTVFSVFTKMPQGLDAYKNFINENEIGEWIHTTSINDNYKTVYDIKSFPQIYVLDEQKKIVMKKIGAEQLKEVMEKIMK